MASRRLLAATLLLWGAHAGVLARAAHEGTRTGGDAPAHAGVLGASPSYSDIHVQDWGVTRDGRHVERVSVENARGMRLSYIDYGATLTEVALPDGHGKRVNVILSLPSLAAYEANGRRYGAIMGRYAGRIGNAQFTLDGNTIALVPNAKGVHLHGDPDGFDRRVWQRRDFADATSLGSVFTLVSPAGDQHFPGTVTVQVTYRLMRQQNAFHIEYAASTDAPTVINLTNHGFYNLAGAGSAGLATHRFMIAADRYTVTDAKRVPTGELASVEGTALDFRHPASVSARLQASSLLGDPPGFDHSLLFAPRAHADAPVAVITETTSGRRMTVRTTEPSVQFNSGNGFDGSEVGSEGVGYQRYAGFAFETQHLPDSPNHPNFPSTTLRPGQPYRSRTVFEFK